VTRLELTVDVAGDADDVDVLVDALAPEHAEEFPGVETGIETVDEDRARLRFGSETVTDMRAAVNAHLRWVGTIEDTLDVDAQGTDPEVH
jgi:tRNA threonylcarbamoyladenosine modification (KEOPS) complex  Pcc1 subunit